MFANAAFASCRKVHWLFQGSSGCTSTRGEAVVLPEDAYLSLFTPKEQREYQDPRREKFHSKSLSNLSGLETVMLESAKRNQCKIEILTAT
jgi:hypothetical protein